MTKLILALVASLLFFSRTWCEDVFRLRTRMKGNYLGVDGGSLGHKTKLVLGEKNENDYTQTLIYDSGNTQLYFCDKDGKKSKYIVDFTVSDGFVKAYEYSSNTKTWDLPKYLNSNKRVTINWVFENERIVLKDAQEYCIGFEDQNNSKFLKLVSIHDGNAIFWDKVPEPKKEESPPPVESSPPPPPPPPPSPPKPDGPIEIVPNLGYYIQVNGSFVKQIPNGNGRGEMVSTIEQATNFTLVPVKDNLYGFKAPNGKYMSRFYGNPSSGAKPNSNQQYVTFHMSTPSNSWSCWKIPNAKVVEKAQDDGEECIKVHPKGTTHPPVAPTTSRFELQTSDVTDFYLTRRGNDLVFSNPEDGRSEGLQVVLVPASSN